MQEVCGRATMVALLLTFVASSSYPQAPRLYCRLPDGSWIDPLVVTGVMIANDTHVSIDPFATIQTQVQAK